MKDGFGFGANEHIKMGLREPEPTTHPDERMRATLSDMRKLCPKCGLEIQLFVGEQLPDVGAK